MLTYLRFKRWLYATLKSKQGVMVTNWQIAAFVAKRSRR